MAEHPQEPLEQIPKTLRDLDRWIRWGLAPHPVDGTPTKRPEGSVLDPDICKPFAEVASREVTSSQGVGFVFTKGVDVPGGRIFGIDIDACRCPASGAIEPWAKELLNAHDCSYTEITPSGTGLRQWVIVVNPPAHAAKIKVPHPPPHNVQKTPEIQLFGSGSGQYVTCTGLHLRGTHDDLRVINDFGWLYDRYGVRDEPISPADLPSGFGPTPDRSDIRSGITNHPGGPDLLVGNWRALGYPSASEAWWDLVRITLSASNQHGEAAASFLVNETPWGHGLVDSREPDRYARLSWVLKDIARVAGKTGNTDVASAFGDFDAEAWEPPAEAKIQRKRLLMAAPEFLAQPSEVPFLVYGVLPRVGLAQFYGDPSCGKTPFALNLAIHVALGKEEWFGYEVDRSGSVVYMIGEDPTGIRERLRAELLQIDAKAPPGFHVTLRPGRLREPEDAVIWAREIQSVCVDPALLVVDTQSRNFGPGNENSTEDMAAYIDNLQGLADTLQCLVLLVHHTGHMAKDRGRGSSTLPAAVDAQYEIRRDGAQVTATSKKAKNWRDPEPMIGTLHAVTLGNDAKGRPVTAVTLQQGIQDHAGRFDDSDTDTHKLLDFLLNELGQPVSIRQISDAIGLSRHLAKKKLEWCEKLGLIFKDVGKSEKSGKRSKTSYVLTQQGLVMANRKTSGNGK